MDRARIVLQIVAVPTVPLTGPGPSTLLEQRDKFRRTQTLIVCDTAVRRDANTEFIQPLQHDVIDVRSRWPFAHGVGLPLVRISQVARFHEPWSTGLPSIREKIEPHFRLWWDARVP